MNKIKTPQVDYDNKLDIFAISYGRAVLCLKVAEGKALCYSHSVDDQ